MLSKNTCCVTIYHYHQQQRKCTHLPCAWFINLRAEKAYEGKKVPFLETATVRNNLKLKQTNCTFKTLIWKGINRKYLYLQKIYLNKFRHFQAFSVQQHQKNTGKLRGKQSSNACQTHEVSSLASTKMFSLPSDKLFTSILHNLT